MDGKRRLIVGALVLLVAVAGGLLLRPPTRSQEAEMDQSLPRVEFRRDGELVASFTVELATTPEQQVRGLMEREHLPEGHGMLFIYPAAHNAMMWMKNMRISLDFLFVDGRGTVVHMVEDVPPCPSEGECPSFGAGQPVRYVLEVPAGTVARYGLQIGDVMRTVIGQ